MEDYTAERIANQLAYRHHRRPDSRNPHLLGSRSTATTAAAVGTY
ncbi:hypothetical protein ACH5AR_33480 [Kitasatospora sp. NPDC018619]